MDPLLTRPGPMSAQTTNLNAAYALGNGIGLVYLVQGLRPSKE